MDEPGTLTQFLQSMNASLDDLGADFRLGAEVSTPIRLTWGPIEHDTYLRYRVTGDRGIEIIDRDMQADRILRELRGTYPDLFRSIDDEA
jgi:hypothetical protein